jgi:hypothetical protein
MTMLPKAVYPNDILHKDRKINPKVHMEAQKTSNSQILSKKTTVVITVPDFKLYYRAI